MNSIPVFYSEKMVANITSFSPSSRKPREVVNSWRELGIPLDVREPAPVTKAQFYQAHDQKFVDDLLACRTENGFGNRSKLVAASLPWTNGAMLSAAREAIKNGCVAVAPASGYHHSGFDFCGAYCSLNGLMIAAAVLLNEGGVARAGILDLDMHFADGTNDIRQRLKLTAKVPHFTAGKYWYQSKQAKIFLEMLPELVEAFGGCDVLLYQAGVDCHVSDPLGGWMNTAEMYERDKIVFETAKRIGLPICFNLGGGYQSPLRKVLDLHDNTLRACANSYLTKET